ncbi:hypothetical protein Glove_165g187 [Diversispora epigaea]|uniref:Uncharacterized protein n=1 Tax=Diversispora epigaea TaxID=1348612 RepID=A0A397ITN9_9GLOM|nr:hypothetical protein Glove_165g187 [Diversispora epigaea]
MSSFIKNLNRFQKYRIPESISVRSSPGDSGTELEIIPSKHPKGQKLKSKKIARTNKRKKVFDNDSEEEDTESDDEKNEKDARNEMKTIIKTINSEFSLNYNQTFTSTNNCKIRRKLIPELQKLLALKFRPSKKLRHEASLNARNFGWLVTPVQGATMSRAFIKNLNRFQKYRIPESISVRSSPGDSGTELEIIPSKHPKGQKLKSKKIARTNKRKKVFDNDSEEEDTESDDEKNEKDARNEMKTIIKTINSEFSLNYNQTFTSTNNCKIRRKLIPELQKLLALKFRPSVTQLMKWLNSIHKSR